MKLTASLLLLLLTTSIYADTTTPTQRERKCSIAEQVRKFKAKFPCPTEFIINGKCTGRVDHVCAGASNGLDNFEKNMQWQSYENSKLKDAIENTEYGRKLFCNPYNSLPYRTFRNCN